MNPIYRQGDISLGWLASLNDVQSSFMGLTFLIKTPLSTISYMEYFR